jgi:hypothetical protein
MVQRCVLTMALQYYQLQDTFYKRGRSWHLSGKTKFYKIGICCFSTKNDI